MNEKPSPEISLLLNKLVSYEKLSTLELEKVSAYLELVVPETLGCNDSSAQLGFTGTRLSVD